MNTDKLLSGHELVTKSATKIEMSLPEVGLKDVIPSGSWLEQKQIQAAVETRKHLIEVERIERSGTLTHAVWREDLMLAEVTQKVGSYWQYLGHNKGKQLYLKPEEALFLMEINCLHLIHNDVKVSLQQAYILLLKEKITLLQYKVYASLSRLGYRVYRHEAVEALACENENNENGNENNENVSENNENGNENNENVSENNENGNENNENENDENVNENRENVHENIIMVNVDKENENENNENGNEDNKNVNETKVNVNEDTDDRDFQEICIEDSPLHEVKDGSIDDDDCSIIITQKTKTICGLSKLQKLKNRKLKPCNVNNLHRFFDSLPELTQKKIVSIKSPQKQFIPSTITLNKSVFTINLQNIHIKNDRDVPMETNIYTINDEVNGSHIRRIRNSRGRTDLAPMPAYSNYAFSNESFQYRQYSFYRPRHTYRSINFSILFQRHYMPNWFFTSRLQLPRIQTQYYQTSCINSNPNFYNNNRKRSRGMTKKQNLEEIKKLATRLKQLLTGGSQHEEFVQSLHRLIQTYNTKYKTRVRLNSDFNIVVEETIVDTIELDDDEEPSRKRPRSDSPNQKIEENLNLLKNFAFQLKELEKNNKSSARHRRAFSKLLRTYNESYNEEYRLNDSYELENRHQITLESSDSDSIPECPKEEPKFRKGKKLRNPFNLLKRLSEQQNEVYAEASTSQKDISVVETKEYSPLLTKIFTKNWLPPENDFGKAEIVSEEDVYNDVTDMKREDILFDYLKIQTCKWDNWLQLKKSFYTSIKEAIAEFQSGVHNNKNNGVNSIVKPGDCTDMASILKKLRIIQTENGIEECNLAIDFDVYDRQVQNFRKTKRPPPHYRIICLDETKPIPSGCQIASLHSQFNDEVIILFAVVGISSISYMQINPTNLPIYISNNT